MGDKKDKKKDDPSSQSSSKPKPGSSTRPSSQKPSLSRISSGSSVAVLPKGLDKTNRMSSGAASSAPVLLSKVDKTKVPLSIGGSSAPLSSAKTDKTKSPSAAASIHRPGTKYASSSGSRKSAAQASISGSIPATKNPTSSTSSSKKEASKFVSAYPDPAKYKSQATSHAPSQKVSVVGSSKPPSENSSQAGSHIPSKYKSIAGSSQPTQIQSIAGSLRSTAPSFAKSTLKSSRDQEMAKRQAQVESLPPKERKEQDKWVQEQMNQRGTCPANLDWIRVASGYICQGKGHGVTDEILAEGKGGLLFRDTKCLTGTREPEFYFGPYYFDKSAGKRGLWRYGGRLPKWPFVPEGFIPLNILPEESISQTFIVLDGIVSISTDIGDLPLELVEKHTEEIERTIAARFGDEIRQDIMRAQKGNKDWEGSANESSMVLSGSGIGGLWGGRSPIQSSSGGYSFAGGAVGRGGMGGGMGGGGFGGSRFGNPGFGGGFAGRGR
ncbi:hypothetical protein EG329_005220 [Mollisiaceae sp. DMI_Dod_QoI]|nr:hypothetical protein EG329_005220 [Helotiales sp. DMI_Dod_QoI]